MSEEEYDEARCEQRGMIAQPGGDGGTVCRHRPGDLTRPLPGAGRDLCSDPRANVTAEMCAEQGGVIDDVEAPLPPAPDPRAGVGGLGGR